ncbi:hypothetical protein M9458_057819 [Cirrhinus mrigala]|uniref:ribonuclease H n=1 Tax=Cirrhinus mrigala TaxID=683832 RepID=A0ABD0MD78_CIRMR
MPFRPCPSGCGFYLSTNDRHYRCVQCLGRKHADAFFSKKPRLSSTASRSGPSTSRYEATAIVPIVSGKSPEDFESSSQYGLDLLFGAPAEEKEGSAASEGEREPSEADVTAELTALVAESQSVADAEMVAALQRAAKEIGVVWVPPPSPEPSRLDDWFLGSGRDSKPRPSPVPLFSEVHEELTKSWKAPLSARSRYANSSSLTTLDGGPAREYTEIPQVERAITMHLCPQNAASWRGRPRLPSRACKFSSTLVAKVYAASGEAASALHAMAILQVYQAKVLKDLHEGVPDPELLQELCSATDYALRATKVMAQALGRAMSTMVVQEPHLWLNLAKMRDAEKVRFLDALISQAGLFGENRRRSRRRPSSTSCLGVQRAPAQLCRSSNPRLLRAEGGPLREQLRPRNLPGNPLVSSHGTNPPGNTASGLRGFSPPATRRFPSQGAPILGTSDVTPLRPLAENFLDWLSLPSPSRWLLRTIRLGYAIQFARRPPKFCGVLATSVRGSSTAVLRAEIAVLLAKDAIETVPSAEMKKGFYTPYFIVPKKSGGLSPILDLRVLNRALLKLPFKMLTLKHMLTCVRTQDWFVATDLKDAYFHVSILPRHRPFLRFAFKGRAYQYKVLPFCLSLSPRVFTKVAEAALAPLPPSGNWALPRRLANPSSLVGFGLRSQGRGFQPPGSVGTSGQLGKEQTLSGAEDLFSRWRTGLGQYVCASLPRERTVSTEVRGNTQMWVCGPPETSSEAPGAHGILSRGHATGPDAHETVGTLASYPSPEMGIAPRQVSCKHHNFVSQNTGPRLHWHINCLELLAVFLALRSPPSPAVEPTQTQVSACHSHSGRSQSHGQYSVTTGFARRRVEAPPSIGPTDLGSIRPGTSRSLCLTGIHPLPVVVHSTRYRCTGTQLAEGPAQVCVSPSEPHCTDTVQSQGGQGTDSLGSPLLAQQNLVLGPGAPGISSSLAHSSEEGPPFSGEGHNLAPAPRSLEPPPLVPGRDQEDFRDLSPSVVNTLLQARAPSTRRLYDLKWRIFVNWCSSRGKDPRRCGIESVLSLLQGGLDRHLSASTLKVHVAAISANHDLGLQQDPFEPLQSVKLDTLSLKMALLTALTSVKRVGELQALSVNSSCLEFGPADSHVVRRPRPGYVPKVPTTPFRDQIRTSEQKHTLPYLNPDVRGVASYAKSAHPISLAFLKTVRSFGLPRATPSVVHWTQRLRSLHQGTRVTMRNPDINYIN